jgi:hypothetical protein
MSFVRILCAFALAIAGTSIARPALAQNVTASNPESVAAVIRGKGFEVETTKDKGGDPMLRAEGKGYKFMVLFYGCTSGRNCATVGLYAGWTGASADVDSINEWNRTNRFGRAYIDKENDPAVEMDIDLDDGGMSRLLFEDHIEFWLSVMANYSKYIFD